MLNPAILLFAFSVPFLVDAASRTSPPAGAIVVRQGTKTAGEFSTIQAAVNSLPSDGSKRSIFVFPGTYTEQVFINRTGPLTLFGSTTDDTTYTQNTVLITHNASLATGAGSDDNTGTLRIHKNDFSMYNINLQNTFGKASSNGQALAVASNGLRLGFYASQFLSYQDTLYANQGTQVYAKSLIQGAVDFIFGRQGLAYFEGNTISSIGPGCVTASGRETNDTGIYLLNRNTLVLGTNALSGTSGKVFLGRPWGDFARVVFKNTNIGGHVNRSLWSIWNPGDERTDHVLFATFANSGAGSSGDTLPSFATALSASQAAQFTIGSAIGSDWASWVDTNYVTGQ